uniref:Uncharacterized protein n=1 Tax=viral metagenome TaxID=1070528 RepID=A0A6C0HHT9_9ZZZZ
MDDIQQTFFSPLGKQYCLYFYILSVIGLVLVAVVLVSALIIGITKRKGLDFYFAAIMGSLGYVIFYFQNRLLYSMCISSV